VFFRGRGGAAGTVLKSDAKRGERKRRRRPQLIRWKLSPESSSPVALEIRRKRKRSQRKKTRNNTHNTQVDVE
jgi:hypothetical protein